MITQSRSVSAKTETNFYDTDEKSVQQLIDCYTGIIFAGEVVRRLFLIMVIVQYKKVLSYIWETHGVDSQYSLGVIDQSRANTPALSAFLLEIPQGNKRSSAICSL